MWHSIFINIWTVLIIWHKAIGWGICFQLDKGVFALKQMCVIYISLRRNKVSTRVVVSSQSFQRITSIAHYTTNCVTVLRPICSNKICTRSIIFIVVCVLYEPPFHVSIRSHKFKNTSSGFY